jgi:uncharacterized membrane protein (DUF485 family)
MTGWIIVLVVSVILTIAFAWWGSNDYDVFPVFFSIIFGVVAFSSIMVVIFSPVSVRAAMGEFQSQKAYIESHVSKGEYDDVAITQTKIEMNTWLFKAQQSQKNYGIFTFYPETIWDLEPIQ